MPHWELIISVNCATKEGGNVKNGNRESEAGIGQAFSHPGFLIFPAADQKST
jgi:hypothetical protein